MLKARQCRPRVHRSFDGWQAGDLHSHSTYSHDVCADPTCEEPQTHGFTVAEQVGNAEHRGLNCLTITDHNTVSQHDNSGFKSPSVTLLHSYEHSLVKGHGGIHGVSKVYKRPTNDIGQLRAVLDEVHHDGDLGVINYPRTGISSMWEYDGLGEIDAIEVWSIAWYLQDPVSGEAGSGNPAALEFYDDLLNQGHRLAVVGGSDNHCRSTHTAQGVGPPTTWMYAPKGDEGTILDAIRAGRTFISARPHDPFVTVVGSTDRDNYDIEIGDVGLIPESDHLAVRTTVANAVGERVQLVVNGDV